MRTQDRPARRLRRLGATVAIVALCLGGVAACGDDEPDGGGELDPTTTVETPGEPDGEGGQTGSDAGRESDTDTGVGDEDGVAPDPDSSNSGADGDQDAGTGGGIGEAG